MSELGFIRQRIPFVSLRPITLKNLLKGVIPTPVGWRTDPTDLDKTTDENLDTHSSNGWSQPWGSSLVWSIEPKKIDMFYVKLDFKSIENGFWSIVEIKLYNGSDVVYSKSYQNTTMDYQLVELNETIGKVVDKVEITIKKYALEVPAMEVLRVYEVKLLYY